jgi:uncharacterized protein YbaP (TraB family)
MHRISIILFVVIALLQTACSSIKKPFYYEVSRGDKKAYVVGTVHYGYNVDELPKFISKDFSEVQTLLVELDLQYGNITSGDQFKEHFTDYYSLNKAAKMGTDRLLTPKAWQNAVSTLPEYKPEVLKYLPPTALLGLLGSKNREQIYTSTSRAYGARNEKMDIQFITKAKSKQYDLIYLDKDINQLISCLDVMSLGAIENLVNPNRIDKSHHFNLLFDAYESGDEKNLNTTIKFKLNAKTIQCMFYDRNYNWAETIDKIDDKKWPLFIAVGAGHLVGESNLFYYLEKKGYAVKRVISRE